VPAGLAGSRQRSPAMRIAYPARWVGAEATSACSGGRRVVRGVYDLTSLGPRDWAGETDKSVAW